MIPQRIERRSHPYQKCALPIKLRNLNYINNNVKKIYKISLKKIQQFKLRFKIFWLKKFLNSNKWYYKSRFINNKGYYERIDIYNVKIAFIK